MIISSVRLIPMKFFKLNCRRFIPESYAMKKFFPVSKRHALIGEKIALCRFSTEIFQSSNGFRNSIGVEKEKKDENINEAKFVDDGDDDDDADDDDDDIDEDDVDDDNDYDDPIDNSHAGDEVVEEDKKQKMEEIFKEIADGNPDILKKLKLLEFEIAVLKEQGVKVPENPTKSQWKVLLKTHISKRKELLEFMGLNETIALRKKRNKQVKLEKTLKNKAEAGFHFYGLSGHTMFLRVYDRSINKLLQHRQLMAKLKILIDCSYQEFMNKKNTQNLAQQIHWCLSEARVHRYPCQLAFCGLNKNEYLGEIITYYVHQIFNETFYCDVSEQSVLDIYPKERLLYLSPHAQDDLIEFNKDDIYIIGAYVDKGFSVKASLAKAKRDKIRVARLPLDHYLSWKQGQKCLPLNTVLKILLDMSFYNDWNIALKSIAQRSKNDPYTRRKFLISNKEEEL